MVGTDATTSIGTPLVSAHKIHYITPPPLTSDPCRVLTPWTWYPGCDVAFPFWRAELWEVKGVL